MKQKELELYIEEKQEKSIKKDSISRKISKKTLFEPENILIFDIGGPMAHFRNIQTNSSSLSYQFPPPTVLTGIIAAIIGYKRDTYYTDFAPDNIFLTVSIEKSIRKIMQTVNYKVYDEPGYTQIPVEILVPKDRDDFDIIYRIYFSINNQEIYDKLKEKLKKRITYYPIYLGISEFIANINYIGEFKIEKINKKINEITLDSVINGIDLLNIEFTQGASFFIEFMRKSFSKNREPGQIIQNVFTNNKRIRFKSTPTTIYKIIMKDKEIYISRLI